MNRRNAISIIGISLAGCVGDSDGTNENTAEREPPIWKTSISTEFDVSEDSPGVEAHGTVVSEFTPGKPVQIKLVMQNQREGEREFQFAPDPPFLSLTEATSEETRAVLVPETMNALGGDLDTVVPESATGGCWRASSAPPQLPYQESVFLSENETVSNTYHLLAHPESEECLPPDTYEFVDSFEVGDGTYESVVTIEIDQNSEE